MVNLSEFEGAVSIECAEFAGVCCWPVHCDLDRVDCGGYWDLVQS